MGRRLERFRSGIMSPILHGSLHIQLPISDTRTIFSTSPSPIPTVTVVRPEDEGVDDEEVGMVEPAMLALMDDGMVEPPMPELMVEMMKPDEDDHFPRYATSSL